MGIDIGRLEEQLMQMSAEGAPGQEFCEAISELARIGHFEQLRKVLPGIVYDELWARYQQKETTFAGGWRRLAQDIRLELIQQTRQGLTTLTRLQPVGNSGATAAWQEIQRVL